MSLVQPYISKLESIKDDLEDIATKIVSENTDYILYLLQEKQLGEGKTSNDSWAGFYKRTTEQWSNDPHNKPRKDKIAGQPYNFEWFGDWFDGMAVKSEKDGFSIFSRDGKTAMLERKYGRLLKLTEKHNKEVNDELIKPKLYKYILDNMFLV